MFMRDILLFELSNMCPFTISYDFGIYLTRRTRNLISYESLITSDNTLRQVYIAFLVRSFDDLEKQI